MRLPNLFAELREGEEKAAGGVSPGWTIWKTFLPQKVKYGLKHLKNAIFLNNTDKLHKNGLGSLGNIALESDV